MAALKNVEVVRERIRALQDERAGLEDQPRTREAVRQKVAADTLRWNEDAVKANARSLQLLAHGQHADMLDVGPAGSLGPLLTLLLGPEALERALLRQIDSVPEGMTAKDRAARLAEISDELDEIEAEEEMLVVQAEDAGERVFRRGDARPEIVLGPRAAPPALAVRSPFYQGLGEVKRPRLALYPTFPSRP